MIFFPSLGNPEEKTNEGREREKGLKKGARVSNQRL